MATETEATNKVMVLGDRDCLWGSGAVGARQDARVGDENHHLA